MSMKEESASDNVLFFHPQSVSVDEQLNVVGLCMALLQVQAKFGAPNQAPRSITTSTRRLFVLLVEPNFYFLLITTRNPSLRHAGSANFRASIVADDFGAGDSVIFADDDVDDSWEEVAFRHMTTAYSMFSMMYGRLGSNVSKLLFSEPRDWRREIAELIEVGLLDKLWPALQRACAAPLVDAGAFVAPAGVEYLPVGSKMHLAIGSLVGSLMTAHPGAIRHVVATSNGKMLHSTLPISDTFTLFHLMQHYLQMGTGLENTQVRKYVYRSSGGDDFLDPRRMLESEFQRTSFLRPRPRAQGDGFDDDVLDRSSSEDKSKPAKQPFGAYPFIFIRDTPLGVFTYTINEVRVMFLVTEKYLRHEQLRSGFLENVSEMMKSECHVTMISKVLPTAIFNSKELDQKYPYHYSNAMNWAVKSSIAARMGPIAPPSAMEGKEMRLSFWQKTIRRSRTVDVEDSTNEAAAWTLSRDELDAVMRLSALRRSISPFDFGDTERNGQEHCSMLAHVAPGVWVASRISSGREFSLVVSGMDSMAEAAAEVDKVAKWVYVGIFVD